MLSWQPIILIRNPIAVFESWLRVEGRPYPEVNSALGRIYTTLKHQRRIFDWYDNRKQNRDDALTEAKAPIVLDADDLIEDREALYKLCSSTGMCTDELILEWEAKVNSGAPSEGNLQHLQHLQQFEPFFRTIWNSTGVDRSKMAKDLDLANKQAEWLAMFGVDRATQLVERVNESWPDYEYLRSFRLC